MRGIILGQNENKCAKDRSTCTPEPGTKGVIFFSNNWHVSSKWYVVETHLFSKWVWNCFLLRRKLISPTKNQLESLDIVNAGSPPMLDPQKRMEFIGIPQNRHILSKTTSVGFQPGMPKPGGGEALVVFFTKLPEKFQVPQIPVVLPAVFGGELGFDGLYIFRNEGNVLVVKNEGQVKLLPFRCPRRSLSFRRIWRDLVFPRWWIASLAMSSWETKSWSTLGVSKPLKGKHDDPTELGYFGIPHFEADPGFQRPWEGGFHGWGQSHLTSWWKASFSAAALAHTWRCGSEARGGIGIDRLALLRLVATGGFWTNLLNDCFIYIYT